MRKLLSCVGALFLAHTLQAQSLFFGFEDWNEKLLYTDVYATRASTPEEQQCYPYLLGKAEEIRFSQPDEKEIVPGWSTEYEGGLMRTTDAYSGKYAIIVRMWYYHSSGILNYGKKAGKEGKVHLEDKFYGISGFYQYKADSFDAQDTYGETSLHIVSYRKNAGTGDLEVLHHDSLRFARSDTYKAFSLPLSAAVAGTVPDSLSIWFVSEMHRRPGRTGGNSCTYAHFLFLDDLQFHFSPFPLSLNEAIQPRIKLYPNPAKNHISLEYNNAAAIIEGIRLSDLSGRVARTFGQNERLLDVQGIASGPYILTVFSDRGPMHQKVFIQ